jgi:hypothetical protein
MGCSTCSFLAAVGSRAEEGTGVRSSAQVQGRCKFTTLEHQTALKSFSSGQPGSDIENVTDLEQITLSALQRTGALVSCVQRMRYV